MRSSIKLGTFVRPLGGRGQAAAGGYYRLDPDDETKPDSLVKFDDPYTCALEGSASFVKDYLPEGHKEVIHFAKCSLVTDEKNNTNVATIQPKIRNSTPWDVIVFGKKRFFGRKRWSKRPLSEERQYRDTLLQHIDALSPKVQTDLAAALYGSTLAGDESLHSAQFMATFEVGKKPDNLQVKDITGLVKIDGGARERYLGKRFFSLDFRNKTSIAYSTSGQKGKSYLDYYLKNDNVRAKYMQLCLRNEEPIDQPRQTIGSKSVESLTKAMNVIAQSDDKNALGEAEKNIFNKVFMKGLKPKKIHAVLKKCYLTEKSIRLNTPADNICTVLEQITNARKESMENAAKIEIQQLITKYPVPKLESFILNSAFYNNETKEITQMYNIDFPNVLKDIAAIAKCKVYHSGSSHEHFEKLRWTYQVLAHLRAATQFSRLPDNKKEDVLNMIDLLQNAVGLKMELASQNTFFSRIFKREQALSRKNTIINCDDLITQLHEKLENPKIENSDPHPNKIKSIAQIELKHDVNQRFSMTERIKNHTNLIQQNLHALKNKYPKPAEELEEKHRPVT